MKYRLRYLFPVLLFGLTCFLAGLQFGPAVKANSGILFSDLKIPELSAVIPGNVKNAEVPKNVAGEVTLDNFWRVWNLVHAEHINRDKFNDVDLINGAIKGMVDAIGDPYTAFLPPDKNKQFLDSLKGTYEGIGAELGMLEEQLIIVAPLSGSPAEKLGIQPQDAILKINEVDTRGMTIPEAVSRIRGKAGEKVSLTLARTSAPESFVLEITREEITVKSVEYLASKSSDTVGYLRLSRFGDNTREDWEGAVAQMMSEKKNLKALVLDLRSNPGGYLAVAIDLAGDFLPASTPVVRQTSNGGDGQLFKTEGQGRFVQIPVVVLVNEGSASAAEILAAALKENRQDVLLVGKKTFGKGTVQEKRDLPDNSGINVTVAKWLTGKGVWVNDTQGLAVDVAVEITPEQITAGEDPQLTKALELASQL